MLSTWPAVQRIIRGGKDQDQPQRHSGRYPVGCRHHGSAGGGIKKIYHAQAAASISRENKIAFLFGSEKFGLTTEEMSFCHQAVTIPTQEGFCSLNLSQAVMVIAWELCRIREGTFPHQPPSQSSAPEKLQNLFVHLEQVLKEIEFITQENTRHMMLLLKEMILPESPHQ